MHIPGAKKPTSGGGAVHGFRPATENEMMRIQVGEREGRLTIQVEGRLAGEFIPELETCWQSARAARPDVPIAVDLKDVTCIDRSGRSLLQRMHREGVAFVRAGLAV